MRITESKIPGQPHYHINDYTFEVTTRYKYLGIVLNNKMTWSNHVDYVVSKANRMLSFIISVANNLSSDSLLCLYKCLVLHIIEYGQPAWFIHSRENVEKMNRYKDELHELFSNRENRKWSILKSVHLQTFKVVHAFFQATLSYD